MANIFAALEALILMCKISYISDLCRQRSAHLVADLQDTKRILSNTLEKPKTCHPYDSAQDFIQQQIAEHENKILAIKQETENTKASEKTARGAQEAAEEAEEQAKEAKAVAFYQ